MATTTQLPGFALVTGAASGIGQATAKGLVAAGVSGIALVDVNATSLEATQALLSEGVQSSSKPPTIRTFVCDASSANQVEKTFAAVYSEFGRIDYSVHCAGVVSFGNSVDSTIEAFDVQTSVNYRGVWLCQRAAIALMRAQSLNCEAYPDASIPPHRAQRGAIVNISSVGAVGGMRSSSAYCGSKAAVLAVTRGDALDHALDRIRINAVLPGLIETPMTTSDPEITAIVRAGPLQRVPVKRFGSPEEVADVMVFLCSTGASFVTGSGWPVDGGWMLA